MEKVLVNPFTDMTISEMSEIIKRWDGALLVKVSSDMLQCAESILDTIIMRSEHDEEKFYFDASFVPIVKRSLHKDSLCLVRVFSKEQKGCEPWDYKKPKNHSEYSDSLNYLVNRLLSKTRNSNRVKLFDEYMKSFKEDEREFEAFMYSDRPESGEDIFLKMKTQSGVELARSKNITKNGHPPVGIPISNSQNVTKLLVLKKENGVSLWSEYFLDEDDRTYFECPEFVADALRKAFIEK